MLDLSVGSLDKILQRLAERLDLWPSAFPNPVALRAGASEAQREAGREWVWFGQGDGRRHAQGLRQAPWRRQHWLGCREEVAGQDRVHGLGCGRGKGGRLGLSGRCGQAHGQGEGSV